MEKKNENKKIKGQDEREIEEKQNRKRKKTG